MKTKGAQALLWWLADDATLSATARKIISCSANTILVSAASVWEIAIKEDG
jgi:PIN domain nuclease of toxin-antitoxin system